MSEEQLLARFTDRSKKVLEIALREALSLGHNYIGPEHILLAIEREAESLGGRVLKQEAPEIRDVVVAALRSPRRPRAAPVSIDATTALIASLEETLEAVRVFAREVRS